jgi:general secretion pathway protein A
MYEAYFGLSGKPFQLNPDPSFYFESRQHKRAMGFLEYGLHQNEGFIVITGEIGAGKTTLVRSLLERLDAKSVIAAHLVSTQLEADDMLRMVAGAFGIKPKDVSKAGLLLSIEAFLTTVARKGKRCLLIVDEAQNLSHRAVEELRMLSNFQIDGHALLQSFLVGQPEFRQILENANMQQLRQRVIAACHVGSMDKDETRGYIEHRLRHVGWKDSPEFAPDAFAAIHDASGGIPRRINSICDRLLLSGFLEDRRMFTKADVEEVADEFRDETRAPKSAKRLLMSAESLEDTAMVDEALRDVEVRAAALQADFKTIEAEYKSGTGKRNTDQLAERLQHIEQGLIRLETTLLRVERNNIAAMTMFKGLIEWVRAHEPEQINTTEPR